ncbi:hypothetical protein C8R43DRAFT_1124812 [Mycena crocata]|nr:hypothetical protein C8R43DRAFT_1124812 [Mycena crocata]
MTSSLDHHHQDGLGPCSAPTTPTIAQYSIPTGLEQLITHHRHLESLLDSALATLTLINQTTAPPLAYTPHVLQVIHVLTHHIITQLPATPAAPTTAHTTPIDTFPVPSMATYAAADGRSVTPTPSENNTATHMIRKSQTLSLSPPTSDTEREPTRVILCFDQKPASSPKPTRVNPLTLYHAISDELENLFEGLGHAKLLAGVQWTRNGNLVLHPAVEACTAKFLAEQDERMWKAIRPLLKLPETYLPPQFDTDEPWHSVVFHGVPMPAARCADVITWSLVNEWTQSSASTGELRGYSVLCSPEDFKTRQSLTLRVSLSSEADALRLIRNGGFMLATQQISTTLINGELPTHLRCPLTAIPFRFSPILADIFLIFILLYNIYTTYYTYPTASIH